MSPTTVGSVNDPVVAGAGAPGSSSLGSINSQQILEAFKSTNPEVYKKCLGTAESNVEQLMQVAEQTGSGPDVAQLATLLTQQYPSTLTFPPPAPMSMQESGPSGVRGPNFPPPGSARNPGSDGEEEDEEDRAHGTTQGAATSSQGGRRGGRNPAMGTEEWARQRKDNHKEVERRRRGNINDGINELGRIVPSGSGEKSKGAILSRAVQYIHHLKENESRNIEKWTLEKLLMDQAMGDLQAQLEEIRRLWETERMARMDLENEVRRLKGEQADGAPAVAGQKRAGSNDDAGEAEKRQRTE